MKKIVVAYSGGLDTSVILKWLKEKYNAEIIAYCADVGQAEELDGLEEKALQTGASKCYIGDLKEDFAENYVYPMFQGADAIAHGATGKGNDQVRFEFAAAAIDPNIKCIAPWRDEEFRSEFPGRAEMIDYAEKHNIPVKASMKKPYSMDRNLLHISFEAGDMEDTWHDASAESDKDMYVLSVSPEDAPDEAQYIQFLYEKGDIIGLQTEGLQSIIDELGDFSASGEKDGYTLLNPYGVMRVLNFLGGKHGIGRVDLVENRFVGMKSRGVYETPGGTIMLAAHRDLETLTVDKEAQSLRDSLIPRYAEMIYNGFWYAPEREAMQELITSTQRTVTGEVRMKLYKGNCICAGRRSPFSLYDEDIATMEGGAEDAYNQNDATGFITLNANEVLFSIYL